MAIARKKYPPAMNPNAPVRSACICGNQKHTLISDVPSRISLFGKEILVLYILMRNCILVTPNVIGALLTMGVTFFKKMSVGSWVVDASNARWSFFPCLMTNVWVVCWHFAEKRI